MKLVDTKIMFKDVHTVLAGVPVCAFSRCSRLAVTMLNSCDFAAQLRWFRVLRGGGICIFVSIDVIVNAPLRNWSEK